MLTLNNIKPADGSVKKRKRVGRGNASGHGTYSTRGLKGQKSRKGVSRNKLKRLGMKPMLLAMPKNRGFKSDKPKFQVVNTYDLNKHFTDGATIDPAALKKAGLIGSVKLPVKILAKGDLTIKNLKLENVSFSAGAKVKLGK